jgi:hypothetical protein
MISQIVNNHTTKDLMDSKVGEPQFPSSKEWQEQWNERRHGKQVIEIKENMNKLLNEFNKNEKKQLNELKEYTNRYSNEFKEDTNRYIK